MQAPPALLFSAATVAGWRESQPSVAMSSPMLFPTVEIVPEGCGRCQVYGMRVASRGHGTTARWCRSVFFLFTIEPDRRSVLVMGAISGLGDAIRVLFEHSRFHHKRALAEATGIHEGTLSAYIAGRKTPSMEVLEQLLDVMDFSVWDLAVALDLVAKRTPRRSLRHPLEVVPGEVAVDAELPPVAPHSTSEVAGQMRDLALLLDRAAEVGRAAASNFASIVEAQEMRHRLDEVADVIAQARRRSAS